MKCFMCCKSNAASDVVILELANKRELSPGDESSSPVDLVAFNDGNQEEKSSAANGSTHRFMERKSSVASSLYYFDALEDVDDSSRRTGVEQEFEVFYDTVTDEAYKEAIPLVQFNHSVHSATGHSMGTLDSTLLAPMYRSSKSRRRSRTAAKSSEEWGFPGSLTPPQLAAYHKFHKELKRRGGSYEEMVYYYSDIEEEPYALCRYLRFNNFNVDKVFQFIDSHVEKWEDAKRNNFYPDINEATGAPTSVLLTQFPILYSGYAKGGYPCCYFNTGNLSVEGIDCVTDLDLIPNVIWYYQIYEMKERYAKAQIDNPGFERLEQLTVMDLEDLSAGFFNGRTYEASIKFNNVAEVFPEMLHKLLILNAPTFFTVIWKLCKQFLDPNTTKRIEIYSSREKGLERLLELVDKSEVPSDYGGDALSTKKVILRVGREQFGRPTPQRQIVELMRVKRRKPAKFDFILFSTSFTTSSASTNKHDNRENIDTNGHIGGDTKIDDGDEKVSFVIFTRSRVRVRFSLKNEEGNEIEGKVLKGPPSNRRTPFCVHFGMVQGPGTYTMIAEADESFSATENFLIIGEVYKSSDDISSFSHMNPLANDDENRNFEG